ncbi:MAG: DNA-binding protein [Candidatus Hydrogenedentota bacterium]
MTMTKRELVIRVANKLSMTQSDVAKIIEGAFDAISDSLARGERWELRDFGVFEVKVRASRIGRNPRTGDQVPVPERRVVTFRPGKKMKEHVSVADEAADASKPVEAPASAPVHPPVQPVTSGD